MLLPIKTSEPRDALQLERTCLSLIRFSTTLFVTSFGIHLNFRLNTTGDSNNDDGATHDKFINSVLAQCLSYVLVGLLLVFLIVTGASYYITINRYRKAKINNFGFNNSINSILMAVLIVSLITLNILLLVDSYISN